MSLTVKFKKLNEDAVTPSYAKEGDAGLDLVATSKRLETEDGSYLEYGTSLAFEIPEGHVGLLFPRSSISKSASGVSLRNSVGVIDSGYRGEVKIRLDLPTEECYWDGQDFLIWRDGEGGPSTNGLPDLVKTPSVGEKVAQLIIVPYPTIELEESSDLSDTDRGDGGFGSTDSKDVLQAHGF